MQTLLGYAAASRQAVGRTVTVSSALGGKPPSLSDGAGGALGAGAVTLFPVPARAAAASPGCEDPDAGSVHTTPWPLASPSLQSVVASVRLGQAKPGAPEMCLSTGADGLWDEAGAAVSCSLSGGSGSDALSSHSGFLSLMLGDGSVFSVDNDGGGSDDGGSHDSTGDDGGGGIRPLTAVPLWQFQQEAVK